MTESQWNAETVAPSGKYGFIQPERTRWEKAGPVVMVVQLVGETWGPTPGRWYADDALKFWGTEASLNLGAGWKLDAEDTAALVEFAEGVLFGDGSDDR